MATNKKKNKTLCLYLRWFIIAADVNGGAVFANNDTRCMPVDANGDIIHIHWQCASIVCGLF
jgi:hypothetical protein